VDEPGYSAEEIERGEDNPGCTVTAHPVGCLLYSAIAIVLAYALYRLILTL
jgi:hypothetical protein